MEEVTGIGMLDHLIEEDRRDNNINYGEHPLQEFKKWFDRYHTGIVLRKRQWYRDSQDPFVTTAIIGFFDNLKDFARRLSNEIHTDIYKDGRRVQLTVGYEMMSDELIVTVDIDNSHTFELIATYMEINQQYSNRHYEGDKWLLPGPS